MKGLSPFQIVEIAEVHGGICIQIGYSMYLVRNLPYYDISKDEYTDTSLQYIRFQDIPLNDYQLSSIDVLLSINKNTNETTWYKNVHVFILWKIHAKSKSYRCS